MAYDVRLGNYVKFLRGTPTAWENISEKNPDTLYFIAEDNAATGKLYLGARLIADGDTAEINTLKELTDVVLSAGIPNKAVLAYDAISGTWKDTPLESILSSIIELMKGATETTDGAAGLVPQPKAGQQNLYLRGDGTWDDPTVALSAVVSTLDETVKKNQEAHELDILTLLGGKPKGTTIEHIVNEHIDALVGAAPDTFDTLEELAAWIAKHEGAIDIADTLSRLSAVESTLFDENGVVDKVEIFDKALYGDGTSAGLVAQAAVLIADMSTAKANIRDLQDGFTNVQIDIEEIYKLLKWQDLYETLD